MRDQIVAIIQATAHAAGERVLSESGDRKAVARAVMEDARNNWMAPEEGEAFAGPSPHSGGSTPTTKTSATVEADRPAANERRRREAAESALIVCERRLAFAEEALRGCESFIGARLVVEEYFDASRVPGAFAEVDPDA